MTSVVRFEIQGLGHHRRREPKLARTPSQSRYMHKSFRRSAGPDTKKPRVLEERGCLRDRFWDCV
jgi:hypothetical protein